jgi:hypothetical protein
LVAAFLLLPKRRVSAGFVLGYSYLIRPEALLVVAGVAGVIIWRERRLVWEILLGTVTCVVPDIFFIQNHTRVWALTGKLGFLEGAWNRHPGSEFLVLIGNNLKTLILLLPGQIGVPLVLLAVLGLVLRPRFASLGLLTLLAVPFFDFAMVDRFWLPSLPFVLLAAGQGAAIVLGSVTFASQKVVRSVLLATVLAGAFLVSSDDVARLSINPNRYIGIQEAGLWLGSQVSEQTKIAAYKPFASYWAGCEFVKYPTDGYIWQLLDDMEAQEVEYLVVNAHVARVFVPQLQSLLGRNADPGLKLRVEPVKIFAFDPSDQTTIIFRLLANDRL